MRREVRRAGVDSGDDRAPTSAHGRDPGAIRRTHYRPSLAALTSADTRQGTDEAEPQAPRRAEPSPIADLLPH